MIWKYFLLITSWIIVYFHVFGEQVFGQDYKHEFFTRVNCSVAKNVFVIVRSPMKCALNCNLDDQCEGYKTLRMDSTQTRCIMFNISDTACTDNGEDKTFVKTELVKQFENKCTGMATSSPYSQTTTKSDISNSQSSKMYGETTFTSTATMVLSTERMTDITTQTVAPTSGSSAYTCAVDAAIYVISSDEIWIIMGSFIQIYTNVDDLTSSNFQVTPVRNLFPDVSGAVDAGYFDGTNIILIQDEMAFLYNINDQSKTSTTTSSHFGQTVPSHIDAVILNDDNDFMLFSGSTVYRITANSISTFEFDNNGANNYFRADNNDIRPNQVIAGFKVRSSGVHYLFSTNSVTKFTEGRSKGTFDFLGFISCS